MKDQEQDKVTMKPEAVFQKITEICRRIGGNAEGKKSACVE